MHEVSLMSSILETVNAAARDAGALRIRTINLTIGEMREVVPEALEFAFEALAPGTLSEGAELVVQYVEPESRCLDCGNVFTHNRYHLECPKCGSWSTELVHGRELTIDNIDVDIPDDDEAGA